MITNELLSYIQIQIANGKSPAVLTSELLKTGWQKEQIDKAYTQLGISTQVTKLPSQSKLTATKAFIIMGIFAAILLCGGILFFTFTKKNQPLTTTIPKGTVQPNQNVKVISPTNIPTPTKPTVSPTTSSSSATLAKQAYHNTQYNFSIYPPAGWTTQEVSNSSIVVWFYGPSNQGNINIVVSSLPQGQTLAQAMAQTKSTLPQLLQGYTSIESYPLTISGHNAYVIGGTFTSGSLAMRNRQLAVQSGSKVFIVTATAISPSWNTYLNLYNASLTSIKVP